ncbi:MAG: nuclease A inhibitor family protein [Acidobacteria bacterium]|nr:nuclease A inhibitor family protein [Acidobacteriota bacterium]
MKTDEELFGALKEATEGLLYMSESDYPVEVVRWDGSEQLSPDYLRKVAGADSSAAVEESTMEELFRVPAGKQEWKGEAQLVEAQRYQRLRKLLEENLTGIKVYRVGEINIGVYVLGKSAEGNWLGVSTRAVET